MHRRTAQSPVRVCGDGKLLTLARGGLSFFGELFRDGRWAEAIMNHTGLQCRVHGNSEQDARFPVLPLA